MNIWLTSPGQIIPAVKPGAGQIVGEMETCDYPDQQRLILLTDQECNNV